MRWGPMCALLLLLTACDDGDATADPELDAAVEADAAIPDPDAALPDAFVDPWCPGPVEQRYDPLGSTELELFPDDLLTREDPDTPTGLRLEVRPEVAPWAAMVPRLLSSAIEDLGALSGFGTHAAVVMRFTGPVAPTEEQVTLYDLSVDPPAKIPVELVLHEAGATMLVQPLRPLRPAARHALFATGLGATEGACVRPSPVLQALLTDTELPAELEPMRARYHAALDLAGVDAHAVSAATVFTTNGDLQVVVDAAADVRDRAYDWDDPPTCFGGDRYRQCNGAFEAQDYRDDRHVATASPEAPWTLKVTAWLPLEGDGPFPTIIFGHGINGERNNGAAIARLYCPRGYAVVATDAMRHGEHPTADPTDDLAALSFLGIDIQQVKIDALALRGNFNQTNLDRLQLVELIRDAPDLDGDGTPDLDVDRLAYWGVSLGGMLGSGLLALGEDFGAGILSVAGGGLLIFVTESSMIAALRGAIVGLFGGEDRFQRMLPLAQTLVDAADPASWGPYVLHERLQGDAPALLFPVADQDETVPPASGRALARALRLAHVQPIVTPVRLLESTPAPVETAGYFQYDRVSTGAGGINRAGHNNTPLSPEGDLQADRFLETWLDDGPAQIIDPYAELGTPRLP